MNKLFEIGTPATAGSDGQLLLEWGPDFFCQAHFQPGSNSIGWLAYYSCDELLDEDAVASTVASNSESMPAAVVSVALPTAMLTPFSKEEEANDLLAALHPHPAPRYFADRISEWQLVNAWSMPADLASRLEGIAGEVRFLHAFTPAIKMYNGFSSSHQVAVHFSPKYFRVQVKKENHLQLVQMYAYQHPLDVVYYLLKIAAAFELEQSDVLLVLSGLIDENSALFRELQQYFANIHFAHAPAVALPEHSLPQHYFTSIYNLAACAL